MFGAYGGAIASTCLTFVSQAALNAGVPEKLGLKRRAVAVKNTRSITKRDMVLNDYLPLMEVDSQTYEVRAGGMLLTCEPAKVLPLAQRYFLF
jgi:urease subunit alpha